MRYHRILVLAALLLLIIVILNYSDYLSIPSSTALKLLSVTPFTTDDSSPQYAPSSTPSTILTIPPSTSYDPSVPQNALSSISSAPLSIPASAPSYADGERNQNDEITNTTDIPRIPEDEKIDLNYMGYLEHQNQPNYTLSYRFLLGGFSVRFRCLVGALWQAIMTNRTFILEYHDRDIHHGGSSYGNWTDFFEPIHSAAYIPQYTPSGAIIAALDGQQHIPHIFDVVGVCAGEWLPNSNLANMHHAAMILWRFNSKARSDLEQILSVFPKWSTRTYYAMHIRRGDKVEGTSKEADYVATETYCKELERLIRLDNGDPDNYPVFVAADSEETIDEVAIARPNWKIWRIKADHLRKGNFSTQEFDKQPYNFRIEGAKLFFAEITMLRYAKRYVCTHSSNVSSILSILRYPNPTCDSVDKRRNTQNQPLKRMTGMSNNFNQNRTRAFEGWRNLGDSMET